MYDQILTITGITILVMVSPGSDMIIVMRNTLLGGRSAGIKSSLGVLSGNLIHITYCSLGLGLLVSHNILVFNALKYACALYLAYLGITSFFSKELSLETNNLGKEKSQKWYYQGLLNNILNPKGILFYLSVFSIVITPNTSFSNTLILIGLMVSISALFWLLFVSTLNGSFFRKFLTKSQKAVNYLFGCLLLFLSIRIGFF